MAYLLGGKACMESLRTDVQDVHWSVSDIISRTGPIKFPSWKFPDKLSCDVDIDDLMEMYVHSDGDEENQVAHIALYELVIDRLVYLIQTMTTYTDQLLNNIQPGGENSVRTSSSAGLVVKKYCARLIHLHTLIQHIQSENKSKSRKISDLERTIQKMNGDGLQNGFLDSSHHSNLSHSTMDEGHDPSFNNFITSSPKTEISKDACNKSSQTIETAFVACESCDVVQKNLRETGDIVIHVCTTQGLPSSLKKFRPQVAGYDWLSANDIMRWTHEQNKDLSRLNKYMDQIVLEVKPLKAEVTAFEKETKQMEHKVRKIENELQLEKDTQLAIKRQYEIKIQEKEITYAENIGSVNRQKDEVTASRKVLERELEKSRVELRQQQSELESLETAQKDLEKELRKTKVDQEEINRLDDKVKSLKLDLNKVSDQLEMQTKDYNMEVAKNKSAQKKNENLQAKQTSLLSRIDDMDRENEGMKEQMNDLEDEKEKLTEELEKIEEDKSKRQQQFDENKEGLENVNRERKTMEIRVREMSEMIQKMEQQVQEAKEREKLLVEYPDLNGPVNPDYKGTGNLVKDMENQIRANLVRVQILEEQSEGLQNSVVKFTSSQGHGHSQDRISSKSSSQTSSNKPMMGGPTQLWKTDVTEEDNRKSYRSGNENNSNSVELSPSKFKPRVKPNMFTMNFDTSATKSKEEFTVTKTTRPESGKKVKDSSKQGRPLSGKRTTMTPVNQTSIGAYLQMKKTGQLGSTGRPPSGKTSSEHRSQGNKGDNSTYSPPMYICSQCDKMYEKERDLEIHRSYCSPC